jgi:hypothetical protein
VKIDPAPDDEFAVTMPTSRYRLLPGADPMSVHAFAIECFWPVIRRGGIS